MLFNRFYFILILIMGVIVLYSYYYYSSFPEFLKLWGNVSKSVIPIYVVSMLISAVGFLAFLYYIYIKQDFTKEQIFNIFILSMIIVFFSIFWTPSSILYLQNKNSHMALIVLFILFIVAISCFSLFYTVYKIQDNNTTLKMFVNFGLFYFFFHTFFLDFIIWSYNFF